jgi:hypothetical protein
MRGRGLAPLAWIIAGATLLHLAGLGWGLPASDGWDVDGIAPRDFLVGTYLTFRPGHYFSYPPLHLLFLSLLTLPVTLLGLARAASLAPDAVVAELTRVPYMTVYAVAARVVACAMAAGTLCAIAAIGKEVWGRTAGLWAAVVAALNAVFTYYAQTSNLDVPYLFWTFLSYLWLTRAIVRQRPVLLRGGAVFAVFATATKDQAYACFLLAFPLAIGASLAWSVLPNARKAMSRELALSAAAGAVLLAVLDGAVVNPSGFAARVRFLFGPGSQDHAYYATTASGIAAALGDTLRSFDRYYPLGIAVFVVAGALIHVHRLRRGDPRSVAGLLPALGVISFTLTFNCVARRTEHRFLLPQSLFLSLYAGVALDVVMRWHSPFRFAIATGAAALGGRALFECVAVNAALLRDPRYDAEAWLGANTAAGETAEVYGNNAYLPRLPSGLRVRRVDPSPIALRSPLPGVEESDAPYEAVAQRNPLWIVMSDGWLWRYTSLWPESSDPGRPLSRVQAAARDDIASRTFFKTLLSGAGGYAVAHVSRYDDSVWPSVDIHASTTRTVYVMRRLR